MYIEGEFHCILKNCMNRIEGLFWKTLEGALLSKSTRWWGGMWRLQKSSIGQCIANAVFFLLLFFWSVATFIQFLFMSALALAFKKAKSVKWHLRDSQNDPRHYGQEFNHSMTIDESLYEWCSAKACIIQKSPRGRDEYYVYMDEWNKRKTMKWVL